jgi:hypothetical protein
MMKMTSAFVSIAEAYKEQGIVCNVYFHPAMVNFTNILLAHLRQYSSAKKVQI